MKNSFPRSLFSIVAAWLCVLGALGVATAPASAQTTLTTLYEFTGEDDGSNPSAGLIQGSDGNFYGTTEYNEYNDYESVGTVFKITPTGALTSLTIFGGSYDGSNPTDSLVQGNDGNLYGTASAGGTSGLGTVFKLAIGGDESENPTPLVNFTGHSNTMPNGNGGVPIGGLVQGSDGNFYGTTAENNGTVFKMTPAGSLTTLVTFNGTNGSTPYASLIQGNDGNFYGTTIGGGSYGAGSGGYGTVFKMTPSGTLTTLLSFNGTDGASPRCALIQTSDGNFYGTTWQGGSTMSGNNAGYGTVFKMTPFGTLTTLANFTGTNGGSPAGGVVQGYDGNFYGTTQENTVFRVTPSGVLTTLATFTGANGDLPDAPLVQGRDGNLYGTTYTGGSGAEGHYAGNGTVFRLDLLPQNAQDVAAAPDGTARMLWTRSDGAAGVWILDGSDTETTVGPTYGPVSGWSAKSISVAGDGTSRVLWTNVNGSAGIWAFDANGNETSIGPAYSLSGMTASDLATAPDGTSRLLWTSTSGAAAVWTLNATGTETAKGTTYTVSNWKAEAVGAYNGAATLLWDRNDGAAGLWTLNASDIQQTVGPTYGPISDSDGTWTATDLGTSSDGTSQVLWDRSDGAAGLWSFSAADAVTTYGSAYGPYAGFAATHLSSAADQARVLWVNTSRAAGLWSFGSNDTESVVGLTYGPY